MAFSIPDRVLERMRHAEGAGEPDLTPRQIAADLNISRESVTNALDQLAGGGCVKPHRGTGRDGPQWYLTPAGRRGR